MKAGRLRRCSDVLGGAAVGGCKKQSASSEPAQQFTTIDWANAGTIEGTIHYSKTPPKPVPIDMDQDPACTLGPPLSSEQYVVGKDGGFANVFIYIKDGLGNKSTCRRRSRWTSTRRAAAIFRTWSARWWGSRCGSPTAIPRCTTCTWCRRWRGTSRWIFRSRPRGGRQHRRTSGRFAKPELMMPVRCNNHPWMQAFINVVPNPFLLCRMRSGIM